MGTHKILVNGTAFAVTGGTELINGTICKTGGGRTLVNGTAFEVKFAKPVSLNWLLNETISLPTSTLYGSFTVPGDSEGYVFTKIEQRYLSGIFNLVYATESAAEYVYAGGYLNQWSSAKYRTLNFLEEPTGELLTWLQANAVQQ